MASDQIETSVGLPADGKVQKKAAAANGSSEVAADRLRSFVERIERLEEEKRELSNDIKEVYAESKSSGFDTRILRKVISLRRMEAQDRREQEELVDLYMHALGM